jgi:hypothetical protein
MGLGPMQVGVGDKSATVPLAGLFKAPQAAPDSKMRLGACVKG